MVKNIDWIAIKNEYINTNTSYRKLAEKYNVSKNQIANVAAKENWQQSRAEQWDKIGTKLGQKTVEKITERDSDILSRINIAAENLLVKIEEATGQLNNHLVKNKKKTKVIEYNNNKRPDKPTKEIIDEIEEAEFIAGNVDRKGLEQVANSLKILKDIIKDTNGENDTARINEGIIDIAKLINTPQPNRSIRDFEDE